MPPNLVTRFAPSPTGRLHLGHGYSALLAHDTARRACGRFLLRIEDIDQGRCRAAYVEGIFEDLRWLGLEWGGEILFQSKRGAAYADALDRLRGMGLTYVCTCTRAEIAASAPHGPAGPVYPGTCRDAGKVPDPAIPHCWRLDLAKAVAVAGPLTWHDQIAGPVRAVSEAQGDIVIARKDAAASYHLAAAVDDAAQGITLVVRGMDLWAATHIHRLLQALLDLPTPEYRHHALIVGADGERLAKRKGSVSLADLRADGMDGGALTEMMRAGRFPTGFALAAS
jgi:glutamyl-Q tRNA(Asp) synthetase